MRSTSVHSKLTLSAPLCRTSSRVSGIADPGLISRGLPTNSSPFTPAERVSDYQKAGVMAKQSAKEAGDETNRGATFSLEEDF